MVNTATENSQYAPIVAALEDGGFIIVWPDLGPSFTNHNALARALKAQRYMANGTPFGEEFMVVNTFTDPPGSPTVTGLVDGGFLVSWDNANTVSADTNSSAIYAQRYDQNSVAVGEVFLVNSTFESGQFSASIAALSDGGFVITWDDNSRTGADQSFTAVRAQLYDASGVVQGGEFLVNTITSGSQMSPVVAGLEAGGFVITWIDGSQAIEETFWIGANVRAQIFDSDGAPVGNEFVVNTTIPAHQNDPAIAALSNGGFVITWDDASRAKGDQSGLAIVGQRFSATGDFVGGEFLVNTVTFNSQFYSSVSGLVDGGFAVTWRDNSGAGGFGVDLPFDGDFSASGIRADVLDVPGSTTLFSSVLPAARSGFVGGPPITIFASVINAGRHTAKNCNIFIPETEPVSLQFQETNSDNTPIGIANQGFEISPEQIKSFLLTFSPLTTSQGVDMFPEVSCDGSTINAILGVNTVFLSLANSAIPDILSIAVTPDANGIISIPRNSASFMSVSAINIGVGDINGSTDAAIQVSVDDGGKNLPLLFEICETDATGLCITPLRASDFTITIGSSPRFIAVFAFDQNSGGIPLDPANSRVFLRFTDQNDVVRSVTSSAVTVQ
ncbi:MAG: hypothetical protein COA60_004265 [Robiginitomaculum sp.]|nr:hypothetical protein [Robiginitomaculum sp.]